ncbi:hypothetical protein L1887_51763 [Cichorium endivia]|nr:hypothetical protein L1887_51763 [Cichorium endivia]
MWASRGPGVLVSVSRGLVAAFETLPSVCESGSVRRVNAPMRGSLLWWTSSRFAAGTSRVAGTNPVMVRGQASARVCSRHTCVASLVSSTLSKCHESQNSPCSLCGSQGCYGGVGQAAMDYCGLGWYCTRIALREGRSRALWKGAKQVQSSVWLAKQPLRWMWGESGRAWLSVGVLFLNGEVRKAVGLTMCGVFRLIENADVVDLEVQEPVVVEAARNASATIMAEGRRDARSFLSSIVTCCPVSVLKAEKMSCDGDDRAWTNEGRQGQYFADLVRNASRRASKLPCASWRLLTIVYAAYRRIRRWCESEKVTDERGGGSRDAGWPCQMRCSTRDGSAEALT